MKGKIYTCIIVILFFGILFYFLNKNRNEEIDTINKDFKFAKGIVIKKSTFKGRSVKVKYLVLGKEYISSDGFDVNDKTNIGDSIIIKYSVQNPELMITEFNDKF